MRRGGRLVFLLGLVIAAAAALLLLVFLPRLTRPNPSDQALLAPTEEPVRQVVIARVDIPNNTVLTATELLTVGQIPEAQYNANPNQYFTDVGALQSKITIVQVPAQQPLRVSDVTDAGLSLQIPNGQAGQPRPKALPFQVNNLTGVADQITPGDFVDVIGSFSVNRTLIRPGVNDDGQTVQREQDFTGQSTKTLLQNVQVLRVVKPAPAEGTATPEAGDQTSQQSSPNGQPVDQGNGANGQTGNQTNQANQTGGQASAPTLQPGNWVLILAVTDQQAEVVKYAVEQGAGVTLVLRGRGDNAVETTIGATLDILVSQFGLPIPQPVAPAVISNQQLATVPTTGPAPTTVPTPTP